MAQAIDGTAIVDGLWAGRATVPPGLQFPFYGPMLVPGWTVPPFTRPAPLRCCTMPATAAGQPPIVSATTITPPRSPPQVLVQMWRAVGIQAEIQVCENWSQVLDTSRARHPQLVQ